MIALLSALLLAQNTTTLEITTNIVATNYPIINFENGRGGSWVLDGSLLRWVPDGPKAKIDLPNGKQELAFRGEISVFLRTNVVSHSNQRGCATCDGIRKYGWAVMHQCSIVEPYEPATERWDVQTIERVAVLRFNWMGERSVEQAETLSVTTNRWKLQSEWKSVEQK